jgi:putative spermidine/putrescine transport system permease protein
MTGQYLNAFITTAWLSFQSSVFSVVWGAAITWALVRIRWPWLQKVLTALSSTMANFAGLPLAVAFMVTLGTSGVVTLLLQRLFSLNIMNLGWNLASFHGLLVVYTSFLVPLAVILLLPGFSSLNREWEDAVYSLGASLGTYLRRIVIPILYPSILGTFALLFANAFSTYVTSFAIAGGNVNLVPIQIAYMIDGNVTLDIGLGDALAMEEMIVLGCAVALFLLMQRVESIRTGKRGKKVAS